MTDPKDRIAIWNSFFRLAWLETKHVFEANSRCKSNDKFDPVGGTLGEDETHRLAAVVLCTLSIEARANHLIEELVESGKISNEVGKAACMLPIKHRWFLLPTSAGVDKKISSDSGPHQAVAQLCELRNDFLHVNYQNLKKRLPDSGTLLSYFKRCVEAMEDMNVVLERGRPDGPLTEVLKIGEFQCEKST
jgi:hypothetical protein